MCDVYFRKELHAISRCQVARSCSKSIHWQTCHSHCRAAATDRPFEDVMATYPPLGNAGEVAETSPSVPSDSFGRNTV